MGPVTGVYHSPPVIQNGMDNTRHPPTSTGGSPICSTEDTASIARSSPRTENSFIASSNANEPSSAAAAARDPQLQKPSSN